MDVTFISIDDKGLVTDREAGPPPDPEQVKLCREWIRENVGRRKTINHARNSYGLKHVVERVTETYITNGAFIRAALDEGFEIEPCGKKNAYFNFSYRKSSYA
jgi:hypothetical protein